jgi:hypothetical protein
LRMGDAEYQLDPRGTVQVPLHRRRP